MINKTKINEAIQLFGFKSYEDFAIMPLQGINRMLKISKEEDSFEIISSNNSRLITKFAHLKHWALKS